MEWFLADELSMATNQPTVGVGTPSSAEYVLPQPPRAAGEVVVVAPRGDLAAALRRGSDTARALGERLLPNAESQALLAVELRERLAALDAMIAEASRAQLKGALGDVLAVLEWNDAAHADLLHQLRLASAGAQPIELVDLCEDVAAAQQTPDQPVFVRGQAARPYWGSAPLLADAITAALALVAERTLGQGARSIEIGGADGVLRLGIASAGEPGDGVDPASVARFRHAVERVGAAVKADALGPGSAGLVLELPYPPLP